MLTQYRVLARKYRPTQLSELIGQESLVTVLGNAINSGRVAHAYLFTGIRGVGKTTTARILAKSLNCVNGPTITPCGVCEHCTQIAEDRHMDVLEMDAASRTGVGDIREIIENAKYLPGSARYKIYIIDEVHMLSTNAFNALLKTLEEPPSHVKFFFATTEIRKIPLTILSRCQRFDLKRIPQVELFNHLNNICAKESVAAEGNALSMIIRASEGSARDSLSLLDQAIALSDGDVKAQSVASMLGLIDRTKIFDLFEAVVTGNASSAVAIASEMIDLGSDARTIVSDLVDVVATVSRFIVDRTAAQDTAMPDFERNKALEFAGKMDIAKLSTLWQAMNKAYGEISYGVSDGSAIQMIMIRLAYLASLPSIEDLIASASGGGGQIQAPAPVSAPAQRPVMQAPVNVQAPSAPTRETMIQAPVSEPVARPSAPQVQQEAVKTIPGSFEALVKLFASNREPILYSHLMNQISLKNFSEGRLEMVKAGDLPDDFTHRVRDALGRWTGISWQVEVVEGEAAPTLKAIRNEEVARMQEQVKERPLVQKVMENYPGSTVKNVKLAQD